MPPAQAHGSAVTTKASGYQCGPNAGPLSDALFLLATAYRILYGILGSYITARVAPNRPMQHAMAGGVVGLVLSIVGAVVTWNMGRGLCASPAWPLDITGIGGSVPISLAKCK